MGYHQEIKQPELTESEYAPIALCGKIILWGCIISFMAIGGLCLIS